MHVPVIDLAAEPPERLARRIDEALAGPGFFSVVGHGVPAAVIDAAFAASHRFFALPLEVKERWHVDRRHRGYDPIGWQALDVGQPADLKESFYVGVERGPGDPLVLAGVPNQGPNQWPDEAVAPGFRAAVEAYAGQMRLLSNRLMELFAIGLGLPRDHFAPFMNDPTCTTRLLHYPPQPASAAPGQIGCGAHTDWGALTLLAQDETGGLQVQGPGGAWIDVEPARGALVVNAGDLMQRWTNDRWRSTVHRVINRVQPGRGPRDRWSIAYFFDLDHFARIEPLPGCVGAGRAPRYEPVTAGEHLIEMYRRTTVAA